ncbi:hypothetical protein SY88_10760 [Clostridiales bacterium PH28_bin88]|nr:hypothetical protein SY88_10760 [Clostridiales bacterium PH28_bin88]
MNRRAPARSGFRELIADLNRGEIVPVYLFYGEEQHLHRQALAVLKQKLLPAGMEDWNYEQLDGKEVSPEDIVAVANTMPFMAQRKLVVVAGTTLFQSRQGAGGNSDQVGQEDKRDSKEGALLAYLASPNPTTCLVFLTLNSVDARKKLYKGVEKVGRVVEFSPLRGGDLNEWVKSTVRERGKQIEAEAMEYLVATVGNHLGLLENELEKACLYLGREKSITLPVLRQVVSRTTEAGIFELVDAVGAKNTAHAIRLLREMFLLGEQPVPVALMLARQVRLMLQAKVLNSKGYLGDRLAAAMQVHPFVARKAQAQARNFNEAELERAIEQFLELDVSLKNGRGDPRLLVEVVILRMCS